MNLQLDKIKEAEQQHSKYFHLAPRSYSVGENVNNDNLQQNPIPHLIGRDQEEARERGFYALPLDQVKTPSICIALVGLPASGKTYLARSLMRYLNWMGLPTRLFNLGIYRKTILGTQMYKDAANTHNPTSPYWDAFETLYREVLGEVKDFLKGHPGNPRVAIIDATNTTRRWRDLVRDNLKEVISYDRLIFVETQITIQPVLDKMMSDVIRCNADYNELTTSDAMEEIRCKLEVYRKGYESITPAEGSPFIQMTNFHDHMESYDIQGYIPCRINFLLMNMHLRPKKIFFFPQVYGSPRFHRGVLAKVLEVVDVNLEEAGADKTSLTIWTSSLLEEVPIEMRDRMVQQWKAFDDLLGTDNDAELNGNILESVIFEIERSTTNLLITATLPTCQVLYSYLMESETPRKLCTTVVTMVQTCAYGFEEVELKVGGITDSGLSSFAEAESPTKG